jgi:hypothetical protein
MRSLAIFSVECPSDSFKVTSTLRK